MRPPHPAAYRDLFERRHTEWAPAAQAWFDRHAQLSEARRRSIDRGAPSGTGRRGDGVNLELVERDLIAKTLKEARNNRSQAARLLSITRLQLYYRMQKHGPAVDAARSRD